MLFRSERDEPDLDRPRVTPRTWRARKGTLDGDPANVTDPPSNGPGGLRERGELAMEPSRGLFTVATATGGDVLEKSTCTAADPAALQERGQGGHAGVRIRAVEFPSATCPENS